MKRLLKWLGGIILLLVAIFVVGGLLLPGVAVVQRQTAINAPPEKIYGIVSDMKRFNEWSPWAALDPNTKYTFEGPATGAGQKMSWSSTNPNVGNGSQTVTVVDENKRIETELDFGAMGKAQAAFDLAPGEGGTLVTWGFKSQLNGLVERWFGLMFDRWIGADYERGLAKLKALAEKPRA
jgi:carbon monoxide dehydrogenase subunit G